MAALNLPQHDIAQVLPCMHVYPEPAAVFAADELAQASRHFLPIVSIDLAAIDPTWAGRIHLVQPCENSFEWGEGYFNDWVHPNWLAFHLTEDSRYEWLGDWRCFLLEQPVPDKLPRTWRVAADDFAWVDAQLAAFGVPTPDRSLRNAKGALASTARDWMQATYDLQHASHALARQRWQSSGLLNHQPDLGREPQADDGVCWLDHLGGEACAGNWAEMGGHAIETIGGMDEDGEWDEAAAAYPVRPDGRRFRFIAATTGYHHCASGADGVLLFFEPESRTALITFDRG